MNKISLCTVSMNRRHHVEKTLLKNITDNISFPNIEFILLDYNSNDGLEEFVESNLKKHINEGILTYYRTQEPKWFDRSHSRNMAFRLSTGNIICNVDADNFIGKDFAAYLDKEFNSNTNIFLTTIGGGYSKDILGRICVSRHAFEKINGYDERMMSYGYEDYDIVNRLEKIGFTKKIFSLGSGSMITLEHSHEERVINEFVSKNLDFILVSYIDPSCTDIIYFFKEGIFKRFIYTDNRFYRHVQPLSLVSFVQMKYRYSLLDSPMKEGRWNRLDGDISLLLNEEHQLKYDVDKKNYRIGNNDFHQITSTKLIQSAIMIFSQISNRIIMEKNMIGTGHQINANGFGQGVLHKNFSSETFEL